MENQECHGTSLLVWPVRLGTWRANPTSPDSQHRNLLRYGIIDGNRHELYRKPEASLLMSLMYRVRDA